MPSKRAKVSNIPTGVMQAVILTLEELRMHAVNGRIAAQRQLGAMQRLSSQDRAAVENSVRGQLRYWESVESGINMCIDRAGKGLRWPEVIRVMDAATLELHHIDRSLFEVMQWDWPLDQVSLSYDPEQLILPTDA